MLDKSFLIFLTITSIFLLRANQANVILTADFTNDELKVRLNPDNEIEENAQFYTRNLLRDDFNEISVDETLYAVSRYGKNNRFFFTIGERQNGDRNLVNTSKHVSWKTPTNATLNIKYPGGQRKGRELSYVSVVVFQRSAENRIYVSEGGVKQDYINIVVEANSTKFLGYNATFYGF